VTAMRLIKGKREYKLPPYRQVLCVDVAPHKKNYSYSLTAQPLHVISSFNPGDRQEPLYYALGPNRELYVWPTPKSNGKLRVTLAVTKTV
jgi:hypothetical protein